MSISETVIDCLSRFKALTPGSDDAFKDEYGRFRTWVGNLAAHRTGLRSLQYRLRDSSSLKDTVLSLLRDLRNALQDFAAPTPTADADDGREDFFDSDEEVEAPSTIDPELDNIHEINSCLLRLSLALQNPARQDRLKQLTTTSTKQFEPWDIAHVKQKFPSAETYLHLRLGKALSKQRQYLKYCLEHHSKKVEGLDGDAEEDGEKQTTVATSLRQTVEPNEPAAVPDDSDAESMYTATSFAPTTAGDVDLHPPPLPEAGQDGEEFECPLCYGVVAMAGTEAWKRHVYFDLAPYVCTYRECATAEHRYSQRRDWLDHIVSIHQTDWCCPYGCESSELSYLELHAHLLIHHDISKVDASLYILCKAHARRLHTDQDLQCHLCGKTEINEERCLKHMGRHLQQLALHAVPKSLMGSESDDEAAVAAMAQSELAEQQHTVVGGLSDTSYISSNSESGETNLQPSPGPKLKAKFEPSLESNIEPGLESKLKSELDRKIAACARCRQRQNHACQIRLGWVSFDPDRFVECKNCKRRKNHNCEVRQGFVKFT